MPQIPDDVGPLTDLWEMCAEVPPSFSDVFTEVVEAVVASSPGPLSREDVADEIAAHLLRGRVEMSRAELARNVEEATLGSPSVGVDRAGKLYDAHPSRGPKRRSLAIAAVSETAMALGEMVEERDHPSGSVVGLFSTPLLSYEEEVALATRVKGGDRSAVHELVVANTRLVRQITSKWRRAATTSFDEDDLFQHGCLGVTRAAEKFDPSRGRFTTYATLWVKQSLARGLANESRTIRVPVHIVDLIRKVDRAETDLDAEQMYLTDQEWDHLVAEKSGIDLDDLETLRSVRQEPLPLAEACSVPVLGPTTEEVVENRLTDATVRQSLIHLSESERVVIHQRYGFSGELPHTLEAIGRSVGVTRERVRQIEKAALLKLSKMDSLKGMRDRSQVQPEE